MLLCRVIDGGIEIVAEAETEVNRRLQSLLLWDIPILWNAVESSIGQARWRSRSVVYVMCLQIDCCLQASVIEYS